MSCVPICFPKYSFKIFAFQTLVFSILSGGLLPNPATHLVKLASEDLTSHQCHSVPLPLFFPFLDYYCLEANPMTSNQVSYCSGELPALNHPCPPPFQTACAQCTGASHHTPLLPPRNSKYCTKPFSTVFKTSAVATSLAT